MEKPIERGSYVQDTRHPEYGVGRVLNAGAFATRVLFARGGLRVFRVDEGGKLRTSAPPPPEELEALSAKEARLSQGLLLEPAPDAPKKPVKAKAAKRKSATGAADGGAR